MIYRPLVVWAGVSPVCACDRQYQVITDGLSVTVPYGFPMTEPVAPERDGVKLSLSCQAEGRDGEPCNGRLTVNLSTEHWTADPALLNLFMLDPMPVTDVTS